MRRTLLGKVVFFAMLLLMVPAAFAITSVKIANLPRVLQETSGLIYIKPYLWTLVDDTNTRLYALSPKTGRIKKSVRLLGVRNRDWEALAFDEHYIYVGDLGNNSGGRPRQVIYRFSRAALLKSRIKRVRKIIYSYPGKTKHNQRFNHDYDAEAMIVTSRFIVIFTKNWRSGNTTVYRLPKRPGRYRATRLASLKAWGLTTAASLAKHTLWLLAYRPGLFGFGVYLGRAGFADLDAIANTRLTYQTLNLRCQAEALAVEGRHAWVSCEGRGTVPASLYRLSL